MLFKASQKLSVKLSNVPEDLLDYLFDEVGLSGIVGVARWVSKSIFNPNRSLGILSGM